MFPSTTCTVCALVYNYLKMTFFLLIFIDLYLVDFILFIYFYQPLWGWRVGDMQHETMDLAGIAAGFTCSFILFTFGGIC